MTHKTSVASKATDVGWKFSFAMLEINPISSTQTQFKDERTGFIELMHGICLCIFLPKIYDWTKNMIFVTHLFIYYYYGVDIFLNYNKQKCILA